jgi:hypothetical protein
VDPRATVNGFVIRDRTAAGTSDGTATGKGRKGGRLVGLLTGIGQNVSLLNTDGSAAGVRITTAGGPQESST